MARVWAEHPGARHHGAHGEAAARTMSVPADGFLDFSQNINPFGAPPGALEAARRALLEDVGSYPDLSYSRLREALSGYLEVPADAVVPTNGGAEALFLAARFGGGGGRALVLEPTFSEYAAAARAAGLETAHRVVRRPEMGFRFDWSVLENLDGISVIFLCNPNNPTGDAMCREDALRVAELAREAGALLVVDEAFADFTPSVGVAARVDDHLCVARSFTKFFAIPGLRLGCLVCADASRVQEVQPSWSVNAVAAAAGIAAVRDRGFAARSVAEVAWLRERLWRALGELPGVEAWPGAANFLLVRGPEGLSERLLRRGVLVRGCEPFRGLGPGFFRVAVRRETENGALLDGIREEL